MVSIAARAWAGVIVWKGWAPAAAAWSRIAFIWGSSCIVASSGKINDDLHRTMRLSAELRVLASAAQTPRLTSGLSLQVGEVVKKAGVRFRHAAGIFDSYAGEFEAGYGERHSDAMVIIGFDGGGLKHRRFDAKAIVELLHRRADEANGAIAASVGTMSGIAFISTSTPARRPVPVTSIESRFHCICAPIRSSTRRTPISPWTESAVRRTSVTVPPISAAAAAK